MILMHILVHGSLTELSSSLKWLSHHHLCNHVSHHQPHCSQSRVFNILVQYGIYHFSTLYGSINPSWHPINNWGISSNLVSFPLCLFINHEETCMLSTSIERKTWMLLNSTGRKTWALLTSIERKWWRIHHVKEDA